MRYNAEAADYCTQFMPYRGKRYSPAYIGGHMSFMCNTEPLDKAGIAAPLPKEWHAKEGEAIAFGVDPARLHLFDAGTQARL